MKKEYLIFNELIVKAPRKTKQYEVWAKESDEQLGLITWWPHWRQFVFQPRQNTLYSWDCLSGISEFIKKLMDERKKPIPPKDKSLCR
jgi:hypothetical protein